MFAWHRAVQTTPRTDNSVFQRPARLGLLAVAICMLALPASAAVVYVDATDGSDANGGASWGDAYQTIQYAIDQATVDDDIWVRADTYNLTAQINANKNVQIYGGFPAGTPVWEDRDPVANVTTVDGQDTATHCFYVTADCTIDGFTITGGNADGASGDDDDAGGIYLRSGASTLQNCIVTGNHADIWGGGVGCIGVQNVLNCTISNNTAGYAGGMNISGSTTVEDCTISGNIADHNAGGVYTANSPTISNCSITNNQALHNSGTGGGGGLYVDGDGDPTPNIVDCTITDNTATRLGGGIFCSASANITRCDIRSNTAQVSGASLAGGGGIFLEERPGSHSNKSKIVNCIIANNITGAAPSYTGWGGGIDVDQKTSPEIINCSIVANISSNGGGVYVHSTSAYPNLMNTIMYGNQGGQIFPQDYTHVRMWYCSSSELQGWMNDSKERSNNQALFPHFADYNGPDGNHSTGGDSDYHITSSSEMIDEGTDSHTHYADTFTAPADDFDGTTRPQDAGYDIGAYEYAPDSDGDGVPDVTDNCPDDHNPLQEDDDSDGVGNVCDDCPGTPGGEDVDENGCGCDTQDTQDPVISNCPADIDVDTDPAQCNAVVTWTEPTATDNCGVTGWTSTYSPGDTFDTGTTTVTYTAEDAAGNTADCTFDVTVTDNEDPVISDCPGNINVNVDPDQCDAVVTWTEPTADDNCGVSFWDSSHDSGDTFPVGMTTVTYTAQDDAGNETLCTFDVTVGDNLDPSITCPDDISTTAATGQCTADVTVPAPTVDDNCGVDSVVNDRNFSDDASGTYSIGETLVTWTVTDVNGNTTDCSHTVTVTDDEDPIINTCPPDRELAADANCQAAVPDMTSEVISQDSCGVAGITQDPVAGALIPLGDTNVVMTVSDASDNSVTCTVTLTVGGDRDGDGEPDCSDGCPDDPDKTEPGPCGCGEPDDDDDGDGTPNCDDGCPDDVNKTEPGDCGCGVADTDTDGDGVPDCIDNCPDAPNSDQADADGDGVGDACEAAEPPASGDDDGVDDDTEDGAPNGGDGNGDGIPDGEQDNVASLPSTNGDYITLAVPDGMDLVDVAAIDNPSPDDTPAGAEFPAGFLAFEIHQIEVGGSVELQIIVDLPEGAEINTYWKYGPTPGDPTPHWYEFLYDGTTGAEINGNVITLHLVDGQRGDGDLTANGVIDDPGAPAFAIPSDECPLDDLFCECGGCACGYGAVGYLPLSVLGLAGIKLTRRRGGC